LRGCLTIFLSTELKQKNSFKKSFIITITKAKQHNRAHLRYHAFALKNYFFITSPGLSKKIKKPRELWVPLLAGLWLPVTIAVKILLPPQYIAYVGGTYSIIMWTFMAYVAHGNTKQEIINEARGLSMA